MGGSVVAFERQLARCLVVWFGSAFFLKGISSLFVDETTSLTITFYGSLIIGVGFFLLSMWVMTCSSVTEFKAELRMGVWVLCGILLIPILLLSYFYLRH